MAITASTVAESLINLSHEKQNPISNLKLQKLLFYTQAWHLAIFKRPLFNEDFEAWVHGPVLPAIFRRYRDYKWCSLPNVNPPTLTDQTMKHIEEVWSVYGSIAALDLERLTHSESPWKDARVGFAPDESSHQIISKTSMQKYYSSQLRD